MFHNIVQGSPKLAAPQPISAVGHNTYGGARGFSQPGDPHYMPLQVSEWFSQVSISHFQVLNVNRKWLKEASESHSETHRGL